MLHRRQAPQRPEDQPSAEPKPTRQILATASLSYRKISWYAFRGLPAELNRTLPLDADERVIIEGTLLRYNSYLSQPISYVRLTSNRFLLLRHYAWRPDTVTEVPPRAIRKVGRAGARLEMTWTDHDGRISVISLTPWAMPNAWPPAFTNLDQLTSDLRAWLSSVGWTQPRD